MVNIKDLMLEVPKTIVVHYIDDFYIELKYLPRSELSKIFEESKKIVWDKRDHTKKEEIDVDAFYKKMIDRVLVGWRGLKASTLAKLIPIKITDPDIEIEFTPENALILLQNAYDFDMFIQRIVTDIEKFNAEQFEAEKKI